ncbi:Dehydrogenase (flavoprotein) [Flavobacteriaceae bacterium MAR_2010_188]|nr:Dehydrogenase (flavoprotein) [Flavobacteriaceae bacterium MAR_2010_188]
MAEESKDILIIGAGPSGCVAAAYLQKEGFKVTVVEKSKFPRFVIGESLLPRCMDHFEEVGLLEPLKKRNYEIKRGARFLKNTMSCTFDFSDKHGDGWDWTWQVPREDFDMVLANSIIEKGVAVNFETEVTNIKFNDDGSSITTVLDKENKIKEISARYVIDSSGYGRVLPRVLNLDKPSDLPEHSSIFTHVIDQRRPEGEEGTLITFDVITDKSWLWVIPFSNGITSLGYVGPTKELESYTGSTTEKLQAMFNKSEHYKKRFEGLEYKFEPIQIKNYSKSVTRLYGNGYALTGNSSEFLDPVFSSGVTFATESGLMAAKLIAKEIRGEEVNWEVEYSDYIRSGVEVFSTYVKEWYSGNLQKIFFYPDDNKEIKRQICAVLAGYVWDKSNPFVKNHNRLVKTVAHIIDLNKQNFKPV